VLGCLIAVATRPYAGWFLIAAGAAITLHAGLRSRRGAGHPLVLVAIVVLFAAIAAPTVFEASTERGLFVRLQESQDANAADLEANLSLERVDFSTRGAIAVNLPVRVRDVLFRPYPWQFGNRSQQVALIGSLFSLTLFALLARQLWFNRGQIMARAGPLVYIGLMLLIAYSLSAGNAGTAFRYRTQVVAIAVCLLVVLTVVQKRQGAPKRSRAPGDQALALEEAPVGS
jgi:hypothetical protein